MHMVDSGNRHCDLLVIDTDFELEERFQNRRDMTKSVALTAE